MKTVHLLILLLLLSATRIIAQSSSQSFAKPNIIYILADDLGYGDLGCYGQEKFKTPNIDRLAKEGIMFSQHYAGSAVCAPSRSSLMTGQTTGHTPIRGNKEWESEGQWPLPESSVTISELLKKAGYVTGVFGKWGLGYPGSEGDPNKKGFDIFYGYNCQRLAHNYYPSHLWSNQQRVVLEGNKEGNFNEYAPEIIQQQALQFIEKNKARPFFLFYATTLPHAELLLPEQFLNRYRGKYLPEKKYEGAVFGNKGFREGTYGTQPESHAAFAGMVSLLDQQVGEILDYLNKSGLDKNTIVIFSSDNGPHKEGGGDPDFFNSNSFLKGYKRDLYEGGIRVPMIARWPGVIKAGSKTNHISAFWDVLPTLTEIAGIKTPSGVDGVSFLPTLLNQDIQKRHPYLYWEFHEEGGKQAIRKNNWKLVCSNVLDKTQTTNELYDLINDPGEQHNLAGEYPAIVKELLEQMAVARTPSEVFTF
jgi:arylsulfatase A-like enzyme